MSWAGLSRSRAAVVLWVCAGLAVVGPALLVRSHVRLVNGLIAQYTYWPAAGPCDSSPPWLSLDEAWALHRRWAEVQGRPEAQETLRAAGRFGIGVVDDRELDFWREVVLQGCCTRSPERVRQHLPPRVRAGVRRLVPVGYGSSSWTPVVEDFCLPAFLFEPAKRDLLDNRITTLAALPDFWRPSWAVALAGAVEAACSFILLVIAARLWLAWHRETSLRSRFHLVMPATAAVASVSVFTRLDAVALWLHDGAWAVPSILGGPGWSALGNSANRLAEVSSLCRVDVTYMAATWVVSLLTAGAFGIVESRGRPTHSFAAAARRTCLWMVPVVFAVWAVLSWLLGEPILPVGRSPLLEWWAGR